MLAGCNPDLKKIRQFDQFSLTTHLSGPAVNTLLLRTVVPSASSADVPVTVILPKALSMTLVTRT